MGGIEGCILLGNELLVIHIVNADVGIDVYGCVVPAGILNNFLIHFIFWYGVTVSVSDEFKYYGSTESTKNTQN